MIILYRNKTIRYIYTHMMLLKEITFRYSPTGNTLEQALWDYYAMSAIYRVEGSAGSHISPSSERRGEIIDDVFRQVTDAVAKLYFEKVKTEPRRYAPESAIKDIKKLQSAWRYKDWMNFHAALDSIIKLVKPVEGYERIKKAEMNPKAAINHLSDAVKTLVNGSNAFDKTEPIPDTPTDEPKVMPANQPIPKKRINLPPLASDLPPLPNAMGGDKPKQLDIGNEQFLNNAGFEWDDAKQGYFNNAKGSLIQVMPDNSAVVTLPDGEKRKVRNLGKLIIKLISNRGKTNPIGEPSGVAAMTGVNENTKFDSTNFKKLFNFLYS